MSLIRALLIFCLLVSPAVAAESDLYWLGGTSSTGDLIWIPVSTANPLPTTANGGPTLSGNNIFTGQNSDTPTALTISSTTFTPNNGSNNYNILLTSACASAACTLANFSSTPPAGTAGQIRVTQPASGGPASFGTYGSTYKAAGGTASITLSTAANAVDILSYYSDGTAVYLIPALNFSH